MQMSKLKVGDWVYIKDDSNLGEEIDDLGESFIRQIIEKTISCRVFEDLYLVSGEHTHGFFENHAYKLILNNPLNQKLYPNLVQYQDWLVKPHEAQKIHLQEKRRSDKLD